MEEIRQFKNLVGKYNPYFKRHSALFYLPSNLKELEPMKIIAKSMELLDISGNMTFKSANESIRGSLVLNVGITEELSEGLQKHGKNSEMGNSIRFGTEFIKHLPSSCFPAEDPLDSLLSWSVITLFVAFRVKYTRIYIKYTYSD